MEILKDVKEKGRPTTKLGAIVKKQCFSFLHELIVVVGLRVVVTKDNVLSDQGQLRATKKKRRKKSTNSSPNNDSEGGVDVENAKLKYVESLDNIMSSGKDVTAGSHTTSREASN